MLSEETGCVNWLMVRVCDNRLVSSFAYSRCLADYGGNYSGVPYDSYSIAASDNHFLDHHSLTSSHIRVSFAF